MAWQPTIDNTPITEEQLAKAALQGATLIQVGGRWVQVDRAEAKRALANLHTQRQREVVSPLELLKLAAELTAPTRDITYLFYEAEEIEAEFNGLKRIADTRPELLRGDFAVLMEPSKAIVEAGCQGTMRIEVRVQGRRAHTARAWMGENAIHGLSDVLARLTTYAPRTPRIDGLQYREGLQAVFITGGVAGNVVPDEACITVNHRFAPDRTPAEAEAHLRDVFAGFEVTVVDQAPGALPGLSHPAAAAFRPKASCPM